MEGENASTRCQKKQNRMQARRGRGVRESPQIWRKPLALRESALSIVEKGAGRKVLRPVFEHSATALLLRAPGAIGGLIIESALIIRTRLG